jgi:hypothetical protein
MRKQLLLITLLSIAIIKAYSQDMLTVSGIYQGKNLYVQNPFAGNGVGFCVYECKVNGTTTTDQINSSTFEIDFRVFNFKVGDAVTVVLYHKTDCKPKVLNPEVLKPRSTFSTTRIAFNCKEEKLEWETTGENGKLTYIIEQFRWNKWVKVGEVEGAGTAGNNAYSFKTLAHSGENQFRVKQTDYSGQPRTSPVAKCTSSKAAITFSPKKATTTITFQGGETLWEIIDQYGTIVKKGSGNSIDITSLAKGGYFLNYDNTIGEFVKQ